MKSQFLTILFILYSFFVSSQSKQSIQVLEKDGSPIEGVHIRLVGSSTVLITDQEGVVGVEVNTRGRLIISHISYDPVQMDIDENTKFPLVVTLSDRFIQTEEVVVRAVRANQNNPTSYTNISKNEISEMNLGQDIPYLLDLTRCRAFSLLE